MLMEIKLRFMRHTPFCVHEEVTWKPLEINSHNTVAAGGVTFTHGIVGGEGKRGSTWVTD